MGESQTGAHDDIPSPDQVAESSGVSLNAGMKRKYRSPRRIHATARFPAQTLPIEAKRWVVFVALGGTRIDPTAA